MHIVFILMAGTIVTGIVLGVVAHIFDDGYASTRPECPDTDAGSKV